MIISRHVLPVKLRTVGARFVFNLHTGSDKFRNFFAPTGSCAKFIELQIVKFLIISATLRRQDAAFKYPPVISSWRCPQTPGLQDYISKLVQRVYILSSLTVPQFFFQILAILLYLHSLRAQVYNNF